ncbi:hypothetical protein S7335_3466 [Synechococcus sp. PCC 7335]|uniref:hypothetical protein n=1 Tax=Synechococcus sp. (strain ATCC 29403 / PCC 7335) TaxID=91464 RepID=UPI00017EB4C7|nr:hypothetical protein [Synechococcus sp. PCC 7335]EDX85763.1 hypothetical protein S7335_3466 [Synechococcus sp. PCC 7335]
MSQTERLVMLAEDQLTEYSTDARKIEKLRQKIALSVSPSQQKQVKEELEGQLNQNFFDDILLKQRQAVALPFWGIAGLGLLFGISFTQPVDFIATGIGGAIAILIQKRGWKLQAKDLVVQALTQIEERTQAAKAAQ